MASVTSGADSEVWPDRAIHPGIYLGEEIEAHGLTQTELARCGYGAPGPGDQRGRTRTQGNLRRDRVSRPRACTRDTGCESVAQPCSRCTGSPERGSRRKRRWRNKPTGWTASRSRRWHSATGSNREIRSPIRFGPSSSSSGCNPSPTGMSGMRRSASVSPQRQRRIGSLSIRGCDGARSRVSTCPPSRTTKHVSGMHCWRFAD